MKSLLSPSRLLIASLAFAVTAPAQETPKATPPTPATAAPAKVAPTQAELEEAFQKALTNTTLQGRWTSVEGGAMGESRDEKYTINSVSKLGGENWLVNARIQYGRLDFVAPVPVQVRWAGDTAVICVTDLPIPGAGTYSARVLIYDGTYAGTWNGGGHGGLMNGVLVQEKK